MQKRQINCGAICENKKHIKEERDIIGAIRETFEVPEEALQKLFGGPELVGSKPKIRGRRCCFFRDANIGFGTPEGNQAFKNSTICFFLQ